MDTFVVHSPCRDLRHPAYNGSASFLSSVPTLSQIKSSLQNLRPKHSQTEPQLHEQRQNHQLLPQQSWHEQILKIPRKVSLEISWLRRSLTLSSHLNSVTTADGISIQLLTNGPSRGNTGGSVFGRIKDGTLSYEAGSWARCFLFVLSTLETSRSSPLASALGCWNNEIPVPWKAPWAVLEMGLCLIFSTAALVSTLF